MHQLTQKLKAANRSRYANITGIQHWKNKHYATVTTGATEIWGKGL